jgi:hypothetical protein
LEARSPQGYIKVEGFNDGTITARFTKNHAKVKPPKKGDVYQLQRLVFAERFRQKDRRHNQEPIKKTITHAIHKKALPPHSPLWPVKI